MPAAPDFPPAPDRVAPKRALISLSDKTGLEDAARTLHGLGVELVSTGGTRAAIAGFGLPVKDVADLTGFPEMMDGRVKTLHPVVHGGLLGVRDAADHAEAMATHNIGPIDIVWVDLYPFESTVASGAGFDAVVENIDIGGPAMIRSGSKNHGYVAVCVDQASVAELLEALKADGATTLALRKRLAASAFARTAAYDAAVSGWFAQQVGDAAPARKSISGSLAETLRYGENPHQTGAFYRTGDTRPGVAHARQLQGKELGYNNIADADAAYELVAEFEAPACVIVKHANPCGVAVGSDLAAAYARALECDAVSAFGGVIAVNRSLTGADARLITDIFTEVVIAPGADEEARAIFAARKNLRLLLTDGLPGPVARPQPHRRIGPENRHPPSADSAGDRGHAVRLHGGQARQVQRHRLCEGRPDRRHRRRPDEPSRLRPHRRHPRPRGRRSQRTGPFPGAGVRLRFGSLLPLRRRPAGGSGRRCHGSDPARRLDPRRRGDRSGRRGGRGHGVHGLAGVPALSERVAGGW